MTLLVCILSRQYKLSGIRPITGNANWIVGWVSDDGNEHIEMNVFKIVLSSFCKQDLINLDCNILEIQISVLLMILEKKEASQLVLKAT